MASFGHIAIGLAAARSYADERPWGAALFFSSLSMAPDLDVIAFALKVPYDAPWGHRGATHSFAMAFLAALFFTALARLFHFPVLRTFVTVFLVAASHGILDALTDGGLGPALFWPFSDARYFAPINPIPVAPIGIRFISARGLACVLTELVLFSPFLVYAFSRRHQRSV